MKINLKSSLSFLFILFYLGANQANAQKKNIIYCPPDKEPVIIYKKIKNAYPSYVKSFEANLKANLKLTKGIELLDLNTTVKNQVIELREKLNQTNITWENLIKGAYLIFSQTPCDLQGRKSYYSLLENIRQDNLKLDSLKLSLEEFTSKSSFGAPETTKLEGAIRSYLKNA